MTPADIHARIDRRRRALGLSWERLGERAGLDPRTLRRIAETREGPGLRTLEQVAAALRCSPAELAGWR